MGLVSGLYVYVQGQVPTAAQWNTNPNAVVAVVNGNIDLDNVTPSGAKGIGTLATVNTWVATQTFSATTQFSAVVTVGVDDTGYDVKLFGASAGAFALWDESADTFDIRGATAAGAGILALTTGELTVVDGDILGRINFSAPLESSGADALLVGASIWAEADDTFAAENNDTDLVFATGSSATAVEKMRIAGTDGMMTLVGGLTVGSDLISDTDSTDSLGSASVRWAVLHTDLISMLQGGKVCLDTDADTSIYANTDDEITVEIGSGDKYRFDVSAFRPVTDGNVTLGTNSIRFSNLFTDSIGDTGQALTFANTAFTLAASSTITAPTGGPLNIALSSAAGDDFTVDTSKLVVSGDTGHIGFGTVSPGIVGALGTVVTIESVTGGGLELSRLDDSVGDGSTIASIDAFAGTARNRLGAIIFTAAGTNEAGGNIDFYTTVDGGAFAKKMTILDDGNVGIGTTNMESWDTNRVAIQLGANASFMSQTSDAAGNSNMMLTNLYYDGSNWRFQAASSDEGTAYIQQDGQHYFYRAPAGTSGNVATLALSMAIDSSGVVYIGDTANANMTVGMTINQGANDNEAFALKSSDVVHGITTQLETDTYGVLKKVSSDAGGLRIIGAKDAGGSAGLAINMQGMLGEAADTTKSTAGIGIISFDSYIKSGTNIGMPGADANIFVLAGGGTTRFIFDVEGSAHADVEWTTYDTHDDLGLIRTMEEELLAIEHPAQSERRKNLEAVGVIGKDSWHFENGKQRAMINQTKLQMLHHGALMQVGDRLGSIDARLEAKDNRILALEAQMDNVNRRLN